MIGERSDADREVAAIIAYCARFDPQFGSSVVGASEGDIARLQQLIGIPLPDEYAAFQRQLGRTPAGALGGFMSKIDFGVAAVERYYVERVEPVPDDAIYLWIVDEQFHTFLSRREIDGLRPVVELSWPFDEETGEFVPGEPASSLVAPSLVQFLHREAFVEVRLPALAHRGRLRENVDGTKPDAQVSVARRRAFRVLSERLGFEQIPYSSDELLFFDRDDAALAFFGAEYAPDSVYVGASSQVELLKLMELLADNLNFRRWS